MTKSSMSMEMVLFWFSFGLIKHVSLSIACVNYAYADSSMMVQEQELFLGRQISQGRGKPGLGEENHLVIYPMQGNP